ncbi:hypothetical protein QGP82_29045 [Leptothoe sp. LEGE 181152]|nr:hypothetical protein [Leptothoe sp. LEGE 181152]
MEPLIEYIYIDHKRLDSYFEQISESPIAYDKVPTWKGGVGLTNLGSEVTQSRFPRPFTTHEKVSNLLEYLRKGNFLFEFDEAEFYDYLTLGLADTDFFYTSKTIFNMAFPSASYTGTDEEMQAYEITANNKKERLNSYAPANDKKFHLVNCSLRRVLIPSRSESKQKDISLWVYFFIGYSVGPAPTFSSTAIFLEESNRENNSAEMIFSELGKRSRRGIPDLYPKWLIKLSLEDRKGEIDQTSLNLDLISEIGVNLYIYNESDFFKYLTQAGAIVGPPQKIQILYRVIDKTGFKYLNADSTKKRTESFRRVLYGAPIFIAAA